MSGIDPIVAPATLACLALVMSAAWLVQRIAHNAGWVDVFWSFGTGLAGIGCALAANATARPPGAPAWRIATISVLALVWSGRLGLHIAQRSRSGREDVRYARFRKEWGDAYESRMFVLLMIQAVVAGLLALSIAIAANNPASGLRVADVAGVAILLASIGGETISDRQMARFRRENPARERVCDTGLWGISRHPNYVFEWVGWVGFAVVAIDWNPARAIAAWPIGFAALLGPATMYWLLTRVSGVPPLEREMLESRPDAFADYQRRVPAFLPIGRRR